MKTTHKPNPVSKPNPQNPPKQPPDPEIHVTALDVAAQAEKILVSRVKHLVGLAIIIAYVLAALVLSLYNFRKEYEYNTAAADLQQQIEQLNIENENYLRVLRGSADEDKADYIAEQAVEKANLAPPDSVIYKIN
jgi:cell division protein FtsL